MRGISPQDVYFESGFYFNDDEILECLEDVQTEEEFIRSLMNELDAKFELSYQEHQDE